MQSTVVLARLQPGARAAERGAGVRVSSISPSSAAAPPCIGAAADRAARPRRFFRLEAGQALRLRAQTPGELRVSEGRLWITFDPPARAHRSVARAGDHFLAAGQSIALARRERIVIESCDARAPAGFVWLAAPASQGSARQALADLREAAALAADALRRLLPRPARIVFVLRNR